MRGRGVQVLEPRADWPDGVREQRGERLDRVDARLAQPLGVPELRDDLLRRVARRREQADAGHGREVADQRRHGHADVEQRVPDVGVGQVLGLQRLARQLVAVLRMSSTVSAGDSRTLRASYASTRASPGGRHPALPTIHL
jgi:hypothetical protein